MATPTTTQAATTNKRCTGCRGTFSLSSFNRYLPGDVEGAPTGPEMGTCKKCRDRATAAAAAKKKKAKKNKRRRDTSADTAEPIVAEMTTTEVDEAADRLIAAAQGESP